MSELRCFDLFAGCGGLSLGLEQAGLTVKWANELDEHAAGTYRHSHPNVALFEQDVRVLFERIVSREPDLPRPGDVDLIAGGPPCQGFSGYNRHRSGGDARNSLIEVFLDFVDYLRPRYVLMENVPGMLSIDGGKVPELLLRIFGEIGYETKIGILQAGYYGLPQNRWRVFLWAAQWDQPIPSFPEPTHAFPRTTIFGAKKFRHCVVKPAADHGDLFWKPVSMVSVRDAISDLPPIDNGGGSDEMEYLKAPSSEYQRDLRHDSAQLWDHQCRKLGEAMYKRCCAVPNRPGAGWLDLPHELKPANLLRHGDNRYDNRFGRLDWAGSFNTILTEAHPYWGRVFHPSQNRVISIRECARAQGFPDTVRFAGGIGSRYRQVGNAVPPPLGRRLGEELMKVVSRKCGLKAG